MARIVITEFISLDGVTEAPGGEEGFARGAWAFAFSRGEEGDAFKLDEAMNASALLLGRTTYEGFAKAWPERAGAFADKFNAMPKYVVSSTLTAPSWTNTTVIGGGDVVAAVHKLKNDLDGDIVVHGSMQLARTLIVHDLFDELRLMVYPIVLGTGERLFGDTDDAKRLALTRSQIVGDGVAILVYRPAAQAQSPSPQPERSEIISDEIQADAETPHELILHNTYNAEPSRVWAAWTTPELFAQWWVGPGFRTHDLVMEVEPRGRFSAKQSAADGSITIPFDGFYREVEPPNRLKLTLSDSDDPDEPARTEMTVVLRATADGTEQEFRQTGLVTNEHFEALKAGTMTFLAQLSALVER